MEPRTAGLHLNEIHLICLRMIESALSHSHAYGRPIEVRSITFGPFTSFDILHNMMVSCHGRVRTDGVVKFSAECHIKRSEESEFLPQSIRCVTNTNLVVIGESRLDRQGEERIYVTRT
jgi:hypothetical protein